MFCNLFFFVDLSYKGLEKLTMGLKQYKSNNCVWKLNLFSGEKHTGWINYIGYNWFNFLEKKDVRIIISFIWNKNYVNLFILHRMIDHI